MDVDAIEAERFNRLRQFLEDNIDPDFGLLGKLQSKAILTPRETSDIKDCHPFYRRNILLLDCILKQNKFNNLLDAMRESNQVHLVNYVINNGEYKAEEFGDEWPLREKEELLILNTNQEVFIDLIEPGDLIGRLYSRGVINGRQIEEISSKKARHKKNEALLEILRRRSFKDFKITIRCLRKSNQDHIAELLEQGGAVAKVHAEGLDDTTEDEIIAILKKMTPEERRRIIERTIALDVISVEKGESVVLYVYCKTVNQVIQLKEMQIKGKLRNAVQRLFLKLLTFVQSIEVTVKNPQIPIELMHDLKLRHSRIDEMVVILSEEEYHRCRSSFPADNKLRAVFDFHPDEMNVQQNFELESILQSRLFGLKDEGDTHVELKINANEGQQEEKNQWMEDEEKPEVGDEMPDDDQSGEARLMRNVEEHKLKEGASIAEGSNLTRAEKEQEKSDSREFDEETIHEPAPNLVEDLEEEILFPPEEKESKYELKELEASSEDESEDSEISSAESEDASEEHLNSYKMALTFKKGDIMETILPADIGDATTWWRVKHLESGKVGYVQRRLVIVDYQMKFETSTAISQTDYLKSTTSSIAISNLPLELLDSILQKSYLQRVLRGKQVMRNKDYDAISQLSSVDCCWFQRIRKRKFKREFWRCLAAFYRRNEKISSVFRINRQYMEDNIQLRDLVNLLKFNDCLTAFQTASLFRHNLQLDKKDIFERFRDSISLIVEQSEAMYAVVRRFLYDTKQQRIAEVIENGGAVTKVEIKFRTVKTRHQDLHIIQRVNELRDKTKERSHQIEELIVKLRQEGLEILNASNDGDVILAWFWCKTKYALEKLKTLNKSSDIIDICTELVKNLSLSSEERNPAMTKPKVNIDFEQFEKTVDFFSIVVNFASTLNFRRRREEYEEVQGVTKLRNEIHVLISRNSLPLCVILVFEDEIPFRLQKRIEIKEIEIPNDIASIEMENSLFVLDILYNRKCVWKIKEAGDETEKKRKIMKWLELGDCYSVDGRGALSVTRDGQLLLVGQREEERVWSLWIFGGVESEKGDLSFSISLPEDIQRPQHAVETSKGNFVICHEIKRGENDEMNRNVVSEVSGDGKSILRRFIPTNEKQKLRPFNFCHLAVDSFDRVFLADSWKDRIVLLDPDRQWHGILIPTKEDGKEGRRIHRPQRLFYDEQKKELIIGGIKEVFVYSLNSI